MASKRDLKKQIHYTIYDIVDESYSVQLFETAKTQQSDQIIDAAVDLRDDLLSRIRKARSKSEYRSIVADLKEKSTELYTQVNAL